MTVLQTMKTARKVIEKENTVGMQSLFSRDNCLKIFQIDRRMYREKKEDLRLLQT
ncbi:hypothetical protein HMPREF1981_01575 [Bacteroides pyogenes F0041]|uniref:Uncharacterized protein n=2 Tax=Bacteroides pyogenes TaxID=310300 RepID=U2CNE8_9BACE|nr:hypothetical protein HMPREF1981_01575 [Bacteroides pyogenes F0041]